MTSGHWKLLAILAFVGMLIGGMIENPIVAFGCIGLCCIFNFQMTKTRAQEKIDRFESAEGACSVCRKAFPVVTMWQIAGTDGRTRLVCDPCMQKEER